MHKSTQKNGYKIDTLYISGKKYTSILVKKRNKVIAQREGHE